MKVIVSLTTIPNRIGKIKKTIDSLCDQRRIPDEILLWVPNDYKRVKGKVHIPKFIKDSCITVRRCKDVGSLTKIYYTLKENWEDKDTIIITADDDVYYPPSWVDDLLTGFSMTGKTSMIGVRGRTLNGNKTEYHNSSVAEGATDDTVKKVDLITGTWGALYKVGFFTEDIFDYDVVDENFFVDDIWLNGHMAKNGIFRFVVPNNGVRFIDTVGGIDSLWMINSKSDNNNKMLRYFKNYW